MKPEDCAERRQTVRRRRAWSGHETIGAVAAFYTTRTTTTLVGLALGKIFISSLAHYNDLTEVEHSWQEALQLL